MAFTSRGSEIQVVSYHRMGRSESYLPCFKHSAFSFKDTIAKVLTIFSCFTLFRTKTQFYKMAVQDQQFIFMTTDSYFSLCTPMKPLQSQKSQKYLCLYLKKIIGYLHNHKTKRQVSLSVCSKESKVSLSMKVLMPQRDQ